MEKDNNPHGHLKQRFKQQADELGFNNSYFCDIIEYSQECFVLAFPEFANSFYRVLISGDSIEQVAKDLNVGRKTLNRWLHGNTENNSLGATDWLFIIIQLYKESDYGITYSDTLHRCLTGTLKDSYIRLCAFLDAFVGGGDFYMKLYSSLPWHNNIDPFNIAWPCRCNNRLSPNNKAIGLLTLLHNCRQDNDCFQKLCSKITMLYWWNDLHSKTPVNNKRYPPEEWIIILDILNSGGIEPIAKAGYITDINEAIRKSNELLARELDHGLRQLILDILKHTLPL